MEHGNTAVSPSTAVTLISGTRKLGSAANTANEYNTNNRGHARTLKFSDGL